MEVLVLWRRRHADLAGRDLLALLAHRVDHILRDQAEGVELVGIEPDAHGVIAGTEHGDVADAGQTGEIVDEIDRRVIAHEQAVILPVRELSVTICRIAVFFFSMVTPCACTDSGSEASALLTRFCTST